MLTTSHVSMGKIMLNPSNQRHHLNCTQKLRVYCENNTYLILPFLQYLCKFVDTANSLNKIYYTQRTLQNNMTLVTHNRI